MSKLKSNSVSILFSPNPEDIHLKIVKIKKMWCPICIENMDGHYYHRDCLINSINDKVKRLGLYSKLLNDLCGRLSKQRELIELLSSRA